MTPPIVLVLNLQEKAQSVNPVHKTYINQYNHTENQSNVCPASS